MGFFQTVIESFGNSFFSQAKELVQDRKNELQKEVDAMAKEANKRLDELRANEMETPAFKRWEEGGSVRFGVRGKTYQQVQSEYWRIKRFLDAKTSTVAGAKQVLSQMARNTGFRGSFDLQTSTQYFRLADRIKQYYEMSEESAKALDYQKIWEQVNILVESGLASLQDGNYGVKEIEDMLVEIGELNKESDLLNQYEDNMNGFEAASQNAPPQSIVGQLGRFLGNIGKAILGFFK